MPVRVHHEHEGACSVHLAEEEGKAILSIYAVWLVHDFLREQEKHISVFCIYKSPFLPPAKLGVYGRK